MDRNIQSSVRNTLKTYMPPAKPLQTCIYHNDCPKGKIVTVEYAEENSKQLIKDGWVDTPAKLDLPEESKEVEVKADTSMTTPQLVKACKAAGFHVMNDIEFQAANTTMTDDELIAEARSRGITYKPNKEEILEFAKDYGLNLVEEEPLINRYFQSPTSLTKEELIVLGADYKLKLRMTMKESTMIGHIAKAIEDLKADAA